MASATGHADAKLTLYHCVQARSLRVLWAVIEMGLQERVRLVTLPFPPRILHKAYVDKVNVLGTVPALVDSDAGKLLTESCGAPVYLLNKYASPAARKSLQILPDEPDYADYVNWMSHADATLTFPQTVMLRYTRLEPHKGLQKAGEDYGKWFIARLRLLDRTLADGREFLCGGRFTLADICICYALNLGVSLGLDDKFKPQTSAWRERMVSRPAYIAGCAAEEASLKAFEQQSRL
jgi:glutathione S-transferase